MKASTRTRGRKLRQPVDPSNLTPTATAAEDNDASTIKMPELQLVQELSDQLQGNISIHIFIGIIINI